MLFYALNKYVGESHMFINFTLHGGWKCQNPTMKVNRKPFLEYAVLLL